MQCDVTNKAIVDLLKDTPPQVSFSCANATAECDFQFWIGEVESFYVSILCFGLNLFSIVPSS